MKKKAIKELKTLSAKTDKDIDTSDIPEIKNWGNAVVGRFYRPIKRRLTIRLDADVIEWFKNNNDHYQTAINNALREFIQSR